MKNVKNVDEKNDEENVNVNKKAIYKTGKSFQFFLLKFDKSDIKKYNFDIKNMKNKNKI